MLAYKISQIIHRLYDQTVQIVTRSYGSWTGFVRRACYITINVLDEQILIA